MDAKSFNLSVQGASHIKKNKECQDASASYCDDFCSIAVICDGHGGNDYMRSAYGSKFASEVTLNNIKNFMNSVTAEEMRNNSNHLIKQLEASIINDWNEAIYNHFNENPFTEEELAGISDRARQKYTEQERIESAYGTTIIGVAMTDEFWIGIHIGDGKCVAVNPQGRFLQPIPWDNKCFLNATTSICDSDALSNFRHFYSEKLPIAVFVGSDGIDDCFKDNEQLHNLYRTVLYSFMTNDFEAAVDELYDYLPRLSAKGSGDDMSISAIIDVAKLPNIPSVRDYDTQKEKARVEAAKREEAEKAEAERIRVEKEHRRHQLERAAAMGKVECLNCGEFVSKEARFCEYCGYQLTEKIDGLQTLEEKSKEHMLDDIEPDVQINSDTELVDDVSSVITENDEEKAESEFSVEDTETQMTESYENDDLLSDTQDLSFESGVLTEEYTSTTVASKVDAGELDVDIFENTEELCIPRNEETIK